MISAYNPAGVQYDGNPLTRSLVGLPTIVSAQDIASGAGGDAAAQAAAAHPNTITDGQGMVPSSQYAIPSLSIDTQTGDCSQYTFGSWEWSQCMGQKASDAVGNAVSSTIGAPISDMLNRGLFGVLGLIVVAIGLWFTIAE